jgi:hypothetical protein
MTDYNAIMDSIANYHNCDCEPTKKKFSKSKSPNIDKLQQSKTRRAELEKIELDNFRQVRSEVREAIKNIQKTVDLDEPTLLLLAKNFEDFKKLNKLIGEAKRAEYCLTALSQPKAAKLTYSKKKK